MSVEAQNLTEGIPQRILDEHPEMAAVAEALAGYRAGREVTARCSKCGHKLVVTDFPDIGSLWVGCDIGDTRFHVKYEPQPQVA